VSQGKSVASQVKASLADYNAQLGERITALEKKYHDLGQVTYFKTTPVFDTLLDNGGVFGFANTTGYCDAYQNGTPAQDTQTLPCLPVANYL
jgi:phospholipase/lecithinase/hemolysin